MAFGFGGCEMASFGFLTGSRLSSLSVPRLRLERACVVDFFG